MATFIFQNQEQNMKTRAKTLTGIFKKLKWTTGSQYRTASGHKTQNIDVACQCCLQGAINIAQKNGADAENLRSKLLKKLVEYYKDSHISLDIYYHTIEVLNDCFVKRKDLPEIIKGL